MTDAPSPGLSAIRDRIAAAARDAGRAPEDVALVAVSKVQPDERVQAVLDQGHRLFGENRVQEAEGRWAARKAADPTIRLHLVGPLQSNKVRPALALFDAIETVDRPRLARRIAEEIQVAGRAPQLFIQVNTGEEPQKAGVVPDDVDAFVAECRGPLGLEIAGLMCIPPVEEEPSLHFALLADLAARNGLAGLSMGMSADFETAVRFGATHVRVGSAIFGERDYG